jgi:hypothetical protein
MATLQVILLALASTVRPTSLAATYALLGSAAPRRYVTAYLIAGLAFTVVFGLVIVLVVGEIDIDAGRDATKARAEIAGGLVALAFAVLVLRGRLLHQLPAGDLHREPGRWGRLVTEKLTLRTAIAAGPATHLPGIFYLLALNVIVAHHPRAAGAVAQVLIYNAIWFALPLAALVLCIADPAVARRFVGAINDWARRRPRAIAGGTLLAVGLLLLATGLARL